MTIEPYIQIHSQTPGLQARARVVRGDRVVAELSKYWSFSKYSRREAAQKARTFKRRQLLPFLRAHGVEPKS